MNYSIADHIHPLELKTDQKPYKCDGCRIEGFGSRFGCQICNIDLHKECMFPYLTARHEFFPGSTFSFRNYPPGNYKRICNGCGKFIDGFVYHCEKKDLNLHPCCINLRIRLHVDGIDFGLKNGVAKDCIWCKRKTVNNGAVEIKGFSYESDCNRYLFHVNCAAEMVIVGWKRSRARSVLHNQASSSSSTSSSLALERRDKQLTVAKSTKNYNVKDSQYWKIGLVVLRTIAVICLGGDRMSIFDSIMEFLQ